MTCISIAWRRQEMPSTKVAGCELQLSFSIQPRSRAYVMFHTLGDSGGAAFSVQSGETKKLVGMAHRLNTISDATLAQIYATPMRAVMELLLRRVRKFASQRCCTAPKDLNQIIEGLK